MVGSKKVWAAAAVVPLVAAGLFVAPEVSAQAATVKASAAQAPLSPAAAKALSTGVNQRVIVVFKDQISQAPASRRFVAARRSIEGVEQRSVLNELSETRAQNVHSYTTINAVSATVSRGEEARLVANPAVAEVVPDQVIQIGNPFDPSTAGDTTTTGPSRTPLPGTCATNPNKPELEPQALSIIGADSSDPTQPTARSLGIDGSGVTVGFIADGLNINDPDFIRADGTKVFTDYVDFGGDGTAVATGGDEAFGDASSIAAQGRHVYNISDYSALPLTTPCYIRVEGVAPGASLVGLDIFGAEDTGFNSTFIQAIDYAVSVDHVNVLNESLGSNPYPDDQASLDLIKAANDAAVAAGTTVVASSGDAGVTNTQGAPSTDPNVISAGATTTYELPSQIGYAGFQFPGVTGYLDDNISSLSSSGYQQDGATLSLVAPGELNWALCSEKLLKGSPEYEECFNLAGNQTPIEDFGGTSEASPLTAGVAALVIQAYAKSHAGATPSPALVKQFITSTADDISAPADQQGSGRLDAYRAVLAAEDYQATPTVPQNVLLESSPQFNSVAAEGATKRFTESLTNLGTTTDQVALSTRQLGAYTPIYKTTVTLSSSSPESIDYQGITDNYEVVHFKVPAGAGRLNASIAFQAASSGLPARVRLNLVDPVGQLADYSLPQGIGNYGNAEVANPMPGLWTAYIWSRDTADGGTTGPVLFGASVADFTTFGKLSTSHLLIPAGATKSVTLTVTTPSTPGDSSGSLQITSAGQPVQSVPVTVRALVPSGNTSFTGVLTGGNGRTSVTGVTEYYQFDVSKQTPEINASVTLANSRYNPTAAWLVDPYGLAQATQSNNLVAFDSSSGQVTTQPTLGLNLHVLDPAPGRWTMIVLFAPTVSGKVLSEPFSVSINEGLAEVTATSVPHGLSINANHPTVAFIKVTNTGTGPESYFVDGRIDAAAEYPLASLTVSSTTVPLTYSSSYPVYLVPSETLQITGSVQAAGTQPVQFDMEGPTGDPDVASGQGTSVTATVAGSPYLTSGEWDIAPTVIGPFGPGGDPNTETVSATMTAITQEFDPAVHTAGGDLWLGSLGLGIPISSVIVKPGGSATIPVIFSPTGTAGTTVHGVLYLDDDSLVTEGGISAANANTVAAIPYSYKIGS
jgi:hypothetical protein